MMKSLRFLFFLNVFFLSQATAQEVPPKLQEKWNNESAVPENPLLNQNPTPLPDRITIVPAASDNESLYITWRTDTTVIEGTLEIISGEFTNYPKENRKRFTSTYDKIVHKDYAMHYHKVLVENLEPGVQYAYRVGINPYWSAWKSYKQEQFRDTVRFLYFGDTQNRIYSHTSKIYKDAFKKFPKAKMALHVGDLINHANNDYEWSEWHAATGIINESLPVITARGNHEYLKDLDGHKVLLSDYWHPTFPIPTKSNEPYYYLDYGFVRIIVLNSNDQVYQQGKWLDSLLTVTKQEWVVLVAHHPVFSGAHKRQNKGLLENWLPVIRKHKNKIGLVLQGHDHTYARGGLPERTGTKELPSQPVFTVTVIGHKKYDLDRQDWMDVAYPDVSSYQYIEITKNKISYKAMSETNALIDQFEIRKQP